LIIKALVLKRTIRLIGRIVVIYLAYILVMGAGSIATGVR